MAKRSCHVIVVSGTPGTGKTTIATELATAIDAEYLSLTRYVAKHSLYRGVDLKRRTKIVDPAMARASLREHLATVKGWIVVDSHLSEGIVPKNVVKLVIVLRCHPRILETRLWAKKWGANKIRENVLAEILDSCLLAAVKCYGTRKVLQIDTSKKSVGTCVAGAQHALSAQRLQHTDKADWLTRLENEGSLDRYLK